VKTFVTATKEVVEREVGYAVLAAEGFKTVDEVVFAEKSDLCLLGVRTLEGFGVMVDNVGHRFLAVTTVAAYCTERFDSAVKSRSCDARALSDSLAPRSGERNSEAPNTGGIQATGRSPYLRRWGMGLARTAPGARVLA
jgi:hypothetical protein